MSQFIKSYVDVSHPIKKEKQKKIKSPFLKVLLSFFHFSLG